MFGHCQLVTAITPPTTRKEKSVANKKTVQLHGLWFMLIMTQRSSLFPWLPSPLALKRCPRCPRSLSSSHAPTSSSGEYRHSHTRKESRRTPTTTVPLHTDIVTFRTASLYCRKQTLKVHFFRLCHQSCHQLGMGVADADSGPFQFTESRTGRRGSSELLRFSVLGAVYTEIRKIPRHVIQL